MRAVPPASTDPSQPSTAAIDHAAAEADAFAAAALQAIASLAIGRSVAAGAPRLEVEPTAPELGAPLTPSLSQEALARTYLLASGASVPAASTLVRMQAEIALRSLLASLPASSAPAVPSGPGGRRDELPARVPRSTAANSANLPFVAACALLRRRAPSDGDGGNQGHGGVRGSGGASGAGRGPMVQLGGGSVLRALLHAVGATLMPPTDAAATLTAGEVACELCRCGAVGALVEYYHELCHSGGARAAADGGTEAGVVDALATSLLSHLRQLTAAAGGRGLSCVSGWELHALVYTASDPALAARDSQREGRICSLSPSVTAYAEAVCRDALRELSGAREAAVAAAAAEATPLPAVVEAIGNLIPMAGLAAAATAATTREGYYEAEAETTGDLLAAWAFGTIASSAAQPTPPPSCPPAVRGPLALLILLSARAHVRVLLQVHSVPWRRCRTSAVRCGRTALMSAISPDDPLTSP